MAVIRPSGERYDPDRDLKVAGSFWAVCRSVRQGIESRWKNKTMVAVEFEIADPKHPALSGMRTSFVVPESVYTDPETGSETILMGYARSMGVTDFTNGFDPVKEFVGKRYYVHCELHNGRATVQHAQAAGKRPPAPPPPVSPPPAAPPPVDPDELPPF